ncbi:MAG TPA: metallophosphoesterase [Chthoniobacterales bacterium]|nr:metallophosphoesterase [Chthoniobacterales bacterium]
MKSRFAFVGIFAAVLPGVLTAQAGTAAGFPPLSPVPKTGALKDDPKATKFWFIAAGDNRPASESLPQPDVLSQIFKDAQKFKPVFFLWSGDTIYGHENHRKKLEAQYKEFFHQAQHANVPVFNAPGNHEMDSVQKIGNEKIETPDSRLQAFYLEFMKFPSGAPAYGAFDYGNSRFIALDTEEVATPTPTPTGTPTATATATATPAKKLRLDPGFVSPQQIDLLTQDLEANKSKAHIFVFMHHPIMPAKSSSGLEPAIATALQTLFKNYPNVSYVIAAHEHLYYNATGTTLAPVDRQDPSSQGPSYLVSGGAGAPLDTCPASACSNCGSFNHYLAFEVDGDTVKVQLVPIPSNSPTPTPCSSP